MRKKIDLSKDQEKKCRAIIHSASAAAGAAGKGMAQIPLSDNTLIKSIQIGMIVSLGKVFNQTITDSAAKAILASMAASFIGRSISQFAVGWLLGARNAINSSTAVSLTEAIGWKAAADFYKKQKEDLSVG